MNEDETRTAPSLPTGMAGPVRWVGTGVVVLGAVVLVAGSAAMLLAGEGFSVGPILTAAVLGGIGLALRHFAGRLVRGDGPELPVVASYVFIGVGAVMLVGGIALVFDDPGGFALMAFGLVFAGAGYLARRLFATPAGKRAVAVSSHTVGIRGYDGRRGRRSQASIVHVDENATEAEVEAVQRAWLDEQWRRRPDWVAGRIEADAARSGNLVFVAAGLWTALALALAGAGHAWDEFIWLPAGLAALVAIAFWAAAARTWLHRRKFAPSCLVLETTPVWLGERLAGEVETGVPRSVRPKDGFRLVLRCVHRWEERRGSGSDRRTEQRRDVLWQEEGRELGRASARQPNLLLPVRFYLPEDRPATSLGGGSEGIVWELEVTATLPGLDYGVGFELPVLARGTLPAG